MPFIRAIRTLPHDTDTAVAPPGTEAAEHVVAVLHSVTTTGPTTTTSVIGVHRRIVSGERFRTFDERNHHQADVVARIGPDGRRLLATTIDGRTTQHLRNLPRF
ncbi:hypothetical protein [Oerskovia merdavium]|uniref:DUF3892 domain-containing protein n=1 Tax=Oerskovia merdavium TaxID=2762227 RepID=A0ABR8TZB0_9CELL|nr:hypothetical protein [Oerskovia merdavium]MBD7981114.1 hypothetical protein [Oerskovia merdavium]